MVRDVASLWVTALAAAVRDLVERGRAGRLRQEELEGGTVSVTNLGMFGTEDFAAIINPRTPRSWRSVRSARSRWSTTARWMQAFHDLVEHPVRILA